MKTFITKRIYLIIGILIIFLFWFIASMIINNIYIIPKISDVFITLVNLLLNPRTYLIIFNTISKILITIIVSLIIAIILVIFSCYSSTIEEIIKPSIVLLKTIPVAAVIIILLVIIGSQNSPYIISGLVVMPIMYEAINNGVKAIDQNIIDELMMNSKINLRIIIQIYLPMANPFIMTSLMQSIGLGLKVMVMAEFIVQPQNTIGYEMLMAKNFLQMDIVFAWTMILLVFVLSMEIIIKKIKTYYQKMANSAL